MTHQLYLASQSPRRAELLTQLGITFTILELNVPEIHQTHETPKAFVLRLSKEKAYGGWMSPQRIQNIPVLGADTIVVIEDLIMGKPFDRSDGYKMLKRLSGCTHQVLSAVTLVKGKQIASCLSISRVTFRVLTDAEIKTYWESGEPWGKAGAYAIQGKAASFISRIEGSYTGIMGLPLFETSEILNSL